MQVSIRIAIAIAIVIARDVGLLHVEQTRLGSLAWEEVSRQNLTIEK